MLLKGKKAGLATYAIAARKGGGRTTRLRIALADGTVTESLSESDAGGTALRASNSVRRGKGVRLETIAYNAKGDATIVIDGGKPVVVPFRGKGSRRDPSETWFRTVIPSGATWAVFLALDSRKQTWDEVRVTYVGKRGPGHLVRQLRNGMTTSFTLDDHAVPLVIESGDLRMVRR